MEVKEAFEDKYFMELDPEKRRELLNQYEKTTLRNDNVNLYINLWALRYTDPKNTKQRVDTFLWQIVNVTCLYRVSKLFSKGTQKEIQSAINSLGFSVAEKLGNNGLHILYLELRNTARRYFSTCTHKAYGKKFMGIISMNENERNKKLAREVWQLTDGLSKRFEINEKMALFSKAIRDEYIAQYPDGEALLKFQNEQYNRKKRTA